MNRLLDLDKSSVAGLVDRAERRGLVKRTPSSEDRRSVTVSLAPEGRSLVSKAASDFEADVSAMLGCLSTADQEVLRGPISRVFVAHAAARNVDLSTATSAAWPPLG